MAKITDIAEKITGTVTGAYQKIEDGVVEGFCKVNDKFIEKLFTKEGESVEDAKIRLSGKQNNAADFSDDSDIDAE